MKTITKYKVINWHYFWNETIEIKPIAFLTGVNGSGKSTLIDGMMLLLLGDTTGKFFNKAAMEKSNRTLKGYLRGEIGDNEDGGFKYLREGRFTSYLALELYDDLNDKYFTFGCVFDSFEDGSSEHRFFELNNKIPENEFIQNDIPMSYKQLNAYFNENNPTEFKFFDTNKAYQENLKRKFGGLKDKYFTLLKKSMSFSPITDITTFITEYVCDQQENINLDAMQANILQYKALEAEATAMEEKIKRLEEIDAMHLRYKQSEDDTQICSYIVEKVELQIAQDRLDSYKNQIETFTKRLFEIESELMENETNKSELTRKKIKLVQDQANNDTFRITSELFEERKSLEIKINQLNASKEEIIKTIKNYAETYLISAKELKNSFDRVKIDVLDDNHVSEILDLKEAANDVVEKSNSLLTSVNEGLHYISEDILKNWRLSVTTFKGLISALCVSFAKTIKGFNEKLNALKQEEESMKQGVKPYDSNLFYIKNELQNELRIKYQKHIEVNIFADLIDVKDKSWSDAIEAIMYNQKFNLFVEPKYYYDAYEILKRLLDQKHFYGTALIDQEKIIQRNPVCESGSLAEEILSSHPGAVAYTNFLIGRLKKCYSIQETRESLNGITKDCDLYRNYTLTKINPRLHKISYIGTNIGSKQLLDKRNEIVELTLVISTFNEIYKSINQINALENINTNEIYSILEDIKTLSSLNGLVSSLNYINEELSKHDTVEISSIEKRIDSIDEDLDRLQEENNSLNIEKGNLMSSIQTIKDEKIVNESKAINERLKRIADYDKDFVKNIAEPQLNNEIETGLRLLDIKVKYETLIQRSIYIKQNLLSSVKKLRRDYIQDYHLSFDVDALDNDQFNQELLEIRDVKLPSYKEKIKDSYNKATKQFKDDFISKLKNQIESVEVQIQELNDALASSTFGDDSYHFTCKPNNDYRRYYDMFSDELLLKGSEDDSEFLEKYADVMTDLFNQITTVASNNKHSELLGNIERFTDYRTYLDFDLIVTNRLGEKQRLSKMIKKKSGGETQTPFYIAVLASFAQLYHVNEKGELGNTIRLMIFDEAFSKMDRTRIRESVKLLRKFNLQAIISAPSEKVGDISELVDETLVVLKSNKSSCVRLWAKE